MELVLIELSEFKKLIATKDETIYSLADKMGMSYNGLYRSIKNKAISAKRMQELYTITRIHPVQLFDFKTRGLRND